MIGNGIPISQSKIPRPIRVLQFSPASTQSRLNWFLRWADAACYGAKETGEPTEFRPGPARLEVLAVGNKGG